ncbi:hypothetical protein E2320_019200 [Naja naja]|nr:hypothetical protein E2320_019200 [Naja naja]
MHILLKELAQGYLREILIKLKKINMVLKQENFLSGQSRCDQYEALLEENSKNVLLSPDRPNAFQRGLSDAKK